MNSNLKLDIVVWVNGYFGPDSAPRCLKGRWLRIKYKVVSECVLLLSL